MTDPSENTPIVGTLLPDSILQTGSNIDNEISIRLSRSIWRALAASDQAMRTRLNACLLEEIEGLQMQAEIDDNGYADHSLAVAKLLNQYLLLAE